MLVLAVLEVVRPFMSLIEDHFGEEDKEVCRNYFSLVLVSINEMGEGNIY